MRQVNDAFPDGFTFNDVTLKEFVGSFYDNSPDFSSTNSNGELVSNFVEVGDMFVVRSASTNYLIQVVEVNTTDGDNNDNYVLNIKY